MRIGLPREYFAEGLSQPVRAALDKLVADLKGLGCEIVDVSLPHTEYAVPT
ncbi:MAG: amidase family protein, partial [Nanoarchaeota archaeon]